MSGGKSGPVRVRVRGVEKASGIIHCLFPIEVVECCLLLFIFPPSFPLPFFSFPFPVCSPLATGQASL